MGEQVLIIKDSLPVAVLQPVDAGGLELVTKVTNRQARLLIELSEPAPHKSFGSASATARFLKKDMARKR